MDKEQTEESKERYREAEQKAKVAVSISKRQAYDELYEQLETRGGEKSVFRLAKQRGQANKDIQHVRIIKVNIREGYARRVEKECDGTYL